MSLSKVAVLKTSPETVIEDYTRLMRLVSYTDVVSFEHDILVVVDVSWHHFFPACSTTPWQIDGVVKTLIEDGFPRENIYACYHKTAGVSTKKGEIFNRHRCAVEKHSIQTVHLGEDDSGIADSSEQSMKVLEKLFPYGTRIPECFKNKNIILLPTMKTHLQTTISGALYTLFGGDVFKNLSSAHQIFHDSLVQSLTELKELSSGMLAVMDGTFAGDGAGPRRLDPHMTHYIAASPDPVALDAVAAHMMGFDPLAVPFIRFAHDAGLGTGDIREVDIIGEDIAQVNFHFDVETSVLDFMLKKMESRLSGSILAPFISRIDMMYTDWYWYVAVGEKRIRKAMSSGWGKLFESYRK